MCSTLPHGALGLSNGLIVVSLHVFNSVHQKFELHANAKANGRQQTIVAANHEKQRHHDDHLDHVDDLIVALTVRDEDYKREISVEEVG